MFTSNRALPNSLPAAHARMMDQASIAAAHRGRMRDEIRFPVEAVARDVKCTVDGVGPLDGGCRTVSVTDRDGRSLLLVLDVRDDALAARLKDIMACGHAAEIVYEESRVPRSRRMIEGTILTVS
jgi:hypothetical protein